MSSADHLKNIRERHHSTVRHWFRHSTTDCAHCLTRWPCDASRLLDAVEKVLALGNVVQVDPYDEYAAGYNEALADMRATINDALEGK